MVTRPHRQRHPATAGSYEYPSHLLEAVQQLPAAPGVYTFHGEAGDLPLYIGKSVNLRHRVLSHLRNPLEARMLRQTRHISHVCTGGELGALLLESQMIKLQQPLYNQKLRLNRQLCSLRLEGGKPEVVYASDWDFATALSLYGLYSSRHAALEHLHRLADEHRLCLGALGLEKLAPGKPCFRYMVRQCAGLCAGHDTAQAHAQRLFTALEGMGVACWPYPGAIGLVEEHAGKEGVLRQIHVVRNWCYLGSTPHEDEARRLAHVAAGFDADGYKILCKPLLGGGLQLLSL